MDRKKTDAKPSFTFLAKERVPYSYLVDHEAPPLGLYRPKYDKLDADQKYVNILPDKTELPPEYLQRQWEIDYLLQNKAVPRNNNFIIVKKPSCIELTRDKNMYHRIIMNGECTLEARREITALRKMQREKRSPTKTQKNDRNSLNVE